MSKLRYRKLWDLFKVIKLGSGQAEILALAIWLQS